jgi:hypothetical protein
VSETGGESEEGASTLRVVYSLYDKLNDATINSEDGTVSHKFFKAKDGQPRKFKDEVTFKKWVAKHVRQRREDLKQRLTPNQFYIT